MFRETPKYIEIMSVGASFDLNKYQQISTNETK